MSRRRRVTPLPEPVRPVVPSQQQHGSLRPKHRQIESEEMARWWRQRDNAAKRGDVCGHGVPIDEDCDACDEVNRESDAA